MGNLIELYSIWTGKFYEVKLKRKDLWRGRISITLLEPIVTSSMDKNPRNITGSDACFTTKL